MKLLPEFKKPEKPYMPAIVKLKNFWFQPSFHETQHISKTPSMYVGNHTLYGELDISLLKAKLYNDYDIWLRVLLDKAKYDLPYLRKIMEKNGAFLGTRELCSQAMEQGDNLLLYPGGGREVMKRDGEAYKLIWKDRLGFVKMAASYGYRIQPFASIGADDAYSIIVDASDVNKLPIPRIIEDTTLWSKYFKYGEEIPPLSRGVALSAVPRPEPFFYVFGEGIDTSAYTKEVNNEDAMFELRNKVKAAVEGLIKQGMEIRNQAPRQSYWRRLLQNL